MGVTSVVAPGFFTLTTALFTSADALVTAAQADESCFTVPEVGGFNTALGAFLANVDDPRKYFSNKRGEGISLFYAPSHIRSAVKELLVGQSDAVTRARLLIHKIGVELKKIPEPVYDNIATKTMASGLEVFALHSDGDGSLIEKPSTDKKSFQEAENERLQAEIDRLKANITRIDKDIDILFGNQQRAVERINRERRDAHNSGRGGRGL